MPIKNTPKKTTRLKGKCCQNPRFSHDFDSTCFSDASIFWGCSLLAYFYIFSCSEFSEFGFWVGSEPGCLGPALMVLVPGYDYIA